ncbi:hypothetical protein RHGRI_008514 [Rhododendron griersonianum]|uniref:Uncharacterized protein n=1 Tax=Rhododendron griersonianum TaxID=479676 RepID=A0AAV6L1S5_9ERIC|nr:hypothetical protein RHGRI_008514 [Rhododendron griersonianum]
MFHWTFARTLKLPLDSRQDSRCSTGLSPGLLNFPLASRQDPGCSTGLSPGLLNYHWTLARTQSHHVSHHISKSRLQAI